LTEGTSQRIRAVRLILTIGILGFAIHILLPQIGELGDAVQTLRTGRWRYLGLALMGSVLTYMAGAWTVTAATSLRLSYPRTVLGQLAASVMAVITPAGPNRRWRHS
jgi:uncharacterized membrane protein YbhN (UPF0104 family)